MSNNTNQMALSGDVTAAKTELLQKMVADGAAIKEEIYDQMSEDVTTVQGDIAQEAAQRQTADTQYSAVLSLNSANDLANATADAAEKTRAQAAEASNAAAINAETTTRQAADAANTGADSARAAAQGTKDASQDAAQTLNAQNDAQRVTTQAAKDAEQDASATSITTRVTSLETKSNSLKLADYTQGYVATPLLGLSGSLDVVVPFDSIMLDTNYTPFFHLIGLGLGTLQVAETNPQVRTTTSLKVRFSTTAAITAQGTLIVNVRKGAS